MYILFLKYSAILDFSHFSSPFGVPLNTTAPPSEPPSGPMSMMPRKHLDMSFKVIGYVAGRQPLKEQLPAAAQRLPDYYV